MANEHRRFRVQVNGKEIALTVEPDSVRLADKRLSCTVRDLSNGWFHLVLDGRNFSIFLPQPGNSNGEVRAMVNGKIALVSVKTERDLLLERFGIGDRGAMADKTVRAPMPGLVLETLVEPGGTVRKGDGLLILEAMKMENEVRSTADGTVKIVHVTPGDAVIKNDVLVELE